MIDMHRVVVFFHILLFVYWLGADLGVLLNGVIGNRGRISDSGRAALREAADWVDMGPRTCMVLMVAVGLTLARAWGFPLSAGKLAGVWILDLVWLGLVWGLFLRRGTPLAKKLFWADLALRGIVTVLFLGLGISSFLFGSPVELGWLAAKLVLFGTLVLLGVIIRILILSGALAPPKAGRAADGSYIPRPFWDPLRITVLTIWALVAVMAFLGTVKPF
ncbi:hypothetical protein [Novosphingobium profundi]|uniref:hypothetical protein n=1 Tax=Novosphingobium profundi TaxID=1774954 RepID=UPI001CFECA73|nr:hypothetical protein [Novosphingobium profundi]